MFFKRKQNSRTCEFVVIDFETTGLSPKRGDKIIEVGIVTMSPDGELLDQYETLINPDRDVSAGHIHGISAGMVKDAPMIEDVIEDILYHINGRTVVGHNISFDLRFLNHEIEKYFDHALNLAGVCTLALSRITKNPFTSRKLEALCDYYDIELSKAHYALGDSMSTMELFKILKEEIENDRGVNYFSRNFVKPTRMNIQVESTGISFPRSLAGETIQHENSRISNFLKRLPDNPSSSLEELEYKSLIDRIIEDRVVTKDELDELELFAKDSRISREQAQNIHLDYMSDLVKVYLMDDILTDIELKDLKVVSDLLGISDEQVNELILKEKNSESVPVQTNHNNIVGKSICFTGQLESKINGVPVERSVAQRLAQERGMIIKSGVSKKLDYLVTVDPNSLSGKAKKAREYGVRVISESVFWNMLGVSVE